MDYSKGKYTTTKCSYNSAGSFRIGLSQSGDFDGRPDRVTLKLSFPQLPPLVVADASSLKPESVTYDHRLLGSVVVFRDVDLKTSPSVELKLDPSYPTSVLPNFIGLQGRVRRARYAK